MRRRDGGLFYPDCLERGWLKNGSSTNEPVERRLTKKELSEAHRLWIVHSDIREGRVK